MSELSQFEILSEGFWSNLKTGVKNTGKLLGGVAGAAVKGTAKALDYVAPELTQPLHNLERGVRDVGDSVRRGFDYGYGGSKKAYEDILLDAGYLMTPNQKIIRTGRNNVVTGRRIIGRDRKGKPVGDPKKLLTFLFNNDDEFKIVTSDAQNTSRLNTPKKSHKYKNKVKKP